MIRRETSAIQSRIGLCTCAAFFIALASVMTQGMVMATARETAIDETARNPASASVGGDSVTAQDIGQQIRADRYLAAKAAAAKIHSGIQLFKAEAPEAG
jgi:hypothetical protein